MHVDPFITEFVAQRFAEGQHVGFGCAIYAIEQGRRHGDDGSNVDDRATALFDEVTGSGFCQTRQRQHVEQNHRVHCFNGRLQQCAPGSHARVVDQQTDALVVLQKGGDTRQIVRLVEVSDHHLNIAPGLRGQPGRQTFQPLLVAGHQNQVVALLRQTIGIHRTNPRGSARNQGIAFVFTHHACSKMAG